MSKKMSAEIRRRIYAIIIKGICVAILIGTTLSFADEGIEVKGSNDSVHNIYMVDGNIVSEDVEDRDSTKLPISNTGKYTVLEKTELEGTVIYKMFYDEFNIDLSKKYVILRDEDNNVLKVYNTEDDLYKESNLENDGFALDYYMDGEVKLDKLANNVFLTNKNKAIKKISDGEFKVTVNFTVDGTIVKTVNENVLAGEKPKLENLEYNGKVIRIGEEFLPEITEDTTLDIPIGINGIFSDEYVTDNNTSIKTPENLVQPSNISDVFGGLIGENIISSPVTVNTGNTKNIITAIKTEKTKSAVQAKKANSEPKKEEPKKEKPKKEESKKEEPKKDSKPVKVEVKYEKPKVDKSRLDNRGGDEVVVTEKNVETSHVEQATQNTSSENVVVNETNNQVDTSSDVQVISESQQEIIIE